MLESRFFHISIFCIPLFTLYHVAMRLAQQHDNQKFVIVSDRRGEDL
jgi:hypothetical protein